MSEFSNEFYESSPRTWAGRFGGVSKVEMLTYTGSFENWWLGTFNGTQLSWNQAGNTSNFGQIGSNPFWIGGFTSPTNGEILFFSPGDKNWWLGTFNGPQLSWTLVGNTSGFGDTSKDPTWVGNFTAPGNAELLFYSPGDGSWWLGTFSGTKLNWTLAGNTSNFGNISSNPFWTGNFVGSGQSDMLFFSRGDKNWWLGTFSGAKLNWTLAGNTSGFGDTSSDPTWVGNFTGPGNAELLFYSPGDGSWWLGTFSGTKLNWTQAGNTSNFGNISSNPFWTGNFVGSGQSDMLFFSRGDKNWWLGTFSGAKLNWTLAGNTSGFGDTSSDPTWIGDFTGSGNAEIMFFSRGDGNWWLGTFSGTKLNWTLAANTPPPPPPPPPSGGDDDGDDDDDDDGGDGGIKPGPNK